MYFPGAAAPPVVPSGSGSFMASIGDVQDSAATPLSMGLQAQTPSINISTRKNTLYINYKCGI